MGHSILKDVVVQHSNYYKSFDKLWLNNYKHYFLSLMACKNTGWVDRILRFQFVLHF